MRQFFLHTEKGVYILLTLTAVLWGGNAVTAKITVGELPPVTTAFFRFAWVSVILLSLAVWSEGRKCLPTWRQLPGIVALGVTGIFGHNYLVFSGVKYSTATNMSLLAAANPVITACLAAVFLHERLAPRQMAGVFISFIGVGTIITKGNFGALAQLSLNYGDVLLAIAPVSWAVYSIIGRKVMRGISALSATAWASLIGSSMLLVAACLEGFDGSIALSPLGWVSMAYMIVGSGCLAFFWWNQGVSVVGPNRAAIFVNVIPVSGMAFAALLLRETVTWQQVAGAALIVSGVWLTTSAAKLDRPATTGRDC